MWDNTHGFIVIPSYPLWLFCTLFHLSFSVLICRWAIFSQTFDSSHAALSLLLSLHSAYDQIDFLSLSASPARTALTPIGGAVLPLQILDTPHNTDNILSVDIVILDAFSIASSSESVTEPTPFAPVEILLGNSDDDDQPTVTFPPVPPPFRIPSCDVPTVPIPDETHEVAITVFHTMKQESATWLFSSVDTLETVGRKCTETWNAEFRFELCHSPLNLGQPVVLHDPTVTHHPGLTIVPVTILGPPHTPNLGASRTRSHIRVYNVLTGRKMNVILNRHDRLPVLLRMINNEWSGDFRLRFLGADCPTSLHMYWLDSEFTYQSYVLAFEANPPGAMSNPIRPPFPPFSGQSEWNVPHEITSSS